MTKKSVKVIFDTNVWISFLISKRLAKIKHHISNRSITIVTTSQLITEIKVVTDSEKLQKYFPKENVKELIEFLEVISEKVEIKPTHFINRDPKDNFLLDLIDFSKADYLVTGDKDLLEHHPFKTAQILTPAKFIDQLEKQVPLLK
ncbi:MAG: putative toxin-antitoxin system toxin component, PIN family [Bacteroidetes bacterium]|nr:putative toxin-antitoxin system toxin component, PIN family [Bacteroidota bacterium]